LFRRYWQPALLSEELPERDGAPVRVRLLSEDLIASATRVGALAWSMPIARIGGRRCSMAANEDCGLRCVYHGWKFDVDGSCADLPTEPANAGMKANTKIKAYPTVERGGIVWAYLGRRR